MILFRRPPLLPASYSSSIIGHQSFLAEIPPPYETKDTFAIESLQLVAHFGNKPIFFLRKLLRFCSRHQRACVQRSQPRIY